MKSVLRHMASTFLPPLSLTHAMFLTWSKWLGPPPQLVSVRRRTQAVHVRPVQHDTDIRVHPQSARKRQWFLATLVTTALWWTFFTKPFFFFWSPFLPPEMEAQLAETVELVTSEGPEEDRPSSPMVASPVAGQSAGPSVTASGELKSRLETHWTSIEPQKRDVYFFLFCVKEKAECDECVLHVYSSLCVRCVAEFFKRIVWHACYPQPSSMVGLNSNIEYEDVLFIINSNHLNFFMNVHWLADCPWLCLAIGLLIAKTTSPLLQHTLSTITRCPRLQVLSHQGCLVLFNQTLEHFSQRFV